MLKRGGLGARPPGIFLRTRPLLWLRTPLLIPCLPLLRKNFCHFVTGFFINWHLQDKFQVNTSLLEKQNFSARKINRKQIKNRFKSEIAASHTYFLKAFCFDFACFAFTVIFFLSGQVVVSNFQRHSITTTDTRAAETFWSKTAK